MQWQPLEKLINLHDGYRRLVQLNGQLMLLLQEQGSCYLIGAKCPHYGQLLEQAGVQSGRIICPMHGYGFALEDGRGVDGAGDAVSCKLATRPLDYHHNEIGVWQ